MFGLGTCVRPLSADTWVITGRCRSSADTWVIDYRQVQEFCSAAICPIIQGYGLTETLGGNCIQSIDDTRSGVVGIPLSSVKVSTPNSLSLSPLCLCLCVCRGGVVAWTCQHDAVLGW